MKVLICVTYLTGGGAERVASLWAKGFVENGHNVTIVLNTNERVVSYSVPKSVIIRNIYKKECRIIREIGCSSACRLRKILKNVKPDLIIGVLPSWCKIIWMAKIGLNIPYIDTEHNAFERPKEAPMHWREKIEKFYFSRMADSMTVLTESDLKIIGAKRNRVHVLPNPLPFEPLDSIPEKEKIVLACGRLDVWYTKGFDLLIKAWGNLALKFPDWKLIIVGDGDNKSYNYLKVKAEESGLSNTQLEFVGRCEDMQSLYKKSSIFVLSSRFEGFGMVLTEAMSQGCACIACDYKGRQREIVGNNNAGMVIKTESEEEIYKALFELLTDCELRKKLSTNGIARARKFELGNIMKRWNEIIKDTITKK